MTSFLKNNEWNDNIGCMTSNNREKNNTWNSNFVWPDVVGYFRDIFDSNVSFNVLNHTYSSIGNNPAVTFAIMFF